jgi:hypothetical protein
MLERTAFVAVVFEIEDTFVAARAPRHVTCVQSNVVSRTMKRDWHVQHTRWFSCKLGCIAWHETQIATDTSMIACQDTVLRDGKSYLRQVRVTQQAHIRRAEAVPAAFVAAEAAVGAAAGEAGF